MQLQYYRCKLSTNLFINCTQRHLLQVRTALATWLSTDQCVTAAQLHTGHSPLLAAYLHCIGCQDPATCLHCNGAEETVEHLVFQCPAHDQARRKTRLGQSTDPPHQWSFLERIGRGWPAPDREWERERERLGTIEKPCLNGGFENNATGL